MTNHPQRTSLNITLANTLPHYSGALPKNNARPAPSWRSATS